MLQFHPRAVLAVQVGAEFDLLHETFASMGVEAYRARETAWVVDMAWRSDTIAVVLDARGAPEEAIATVVERIRESQKAGYLPIGVICGPDAVGRFRLAGATAVAVAPLTRGACLKLMRDLALEPLAGEEREPDAPATLAAAAEQAAFPVERGVPAPAGPADEKIRPQQELARLLSRRQGKLKIYMGAAPGVGKTFAMLQEAHDRLARGEDVVIGVVETHGRADTLAKMAGIPELPRHEVEYRGTRLAEMDLDAILERRPAYVLVDELAHTNVPGSLNRKRHEDVALIRLAGINVLSTLNIQHLESLNNLVERITGVKVRETVPDSVLLEATEVVLVDLPPEDLQLRLEAGKIYAPDKITQALSNFFTTHNLTALRELALRELADRVDLRLEEVRASLGRGDEAPGIQERILACIPATPDALRLIRRAARLAMRLNAELTVLHVGEPRPGTDEAKALRDSRELTESLDGTLVVLPEGLLAECIANYASETQSTLIVLGESRRSRIRALLGTPTLDEILNRTTNIDVVIVARRAEAEGDT